MAAKHFCIYCGSDLTQELSEINWPEVMAIEDQIPNPDDLPVILDLDSEFYCRDCEHEYMAKAKVRVTGDSGELISQTVEDQIGDEDKHPAYCQACGAELVAVLPDLEAWVCPICNGINTVNIPISEDCPHCGFPCHKEHIDVVRCVECNTLNFEQSGQYIVPDLDRPGSRFYCGDCYDELFPEEDEEICPCGCNGDPEKCVYSAICPRCGKKFVGIGYAPRDQLCSDCGGK